MSVEKEITLLDAFRDAFPYQGELNSKELIWEVQADGKFEKGKIEICLFSEPYTQKEAQKVENWFCSKFNDSLFRIFYSQSKSGYIFKVGITITDACSLLKLNDLIESLQIYNEKDRDKLFSLLNKPKIRAALENEKNIDKLYDLLSNPYIINALKEERIKPEELLYTSKWAAYIRDEQEVLLSLLEIKFNLNFNLDSDELMTIYFKELVTHPGIYKEFDERIRSKDFNKFLENKNPKTLFRKKDKDVNTSSEEKASTLPNDKDDTFSHVFLFGEKAKYADILLEIIRISKKEGLAVGWRITLAEHVLSGNTQIPDALKAGIIQAEDLFYFSDGKTKVYQKEELSNKINLIVLEKIKNEEESELKEKGCLKLLVENASIPIKEKDIRQLRELLNKPEISNALFVREIMDPKFLFNISNGRISIRDKAEVLLSLLEIKFRINFFPAILTTIYFKELVTHPEIYKELDKRVTFNDLENFWKKKDLKTLFREKDKEVNPSFEEKASTLSHDEDDTCSHASLFGEDARYCDTLLRILHIVERSGLTEISYLMLEKDILTDIIILGALKAEIIQPEDLFYSKDGITKIYNKGKHFEEIERFHNEIPKFSQVKASMFAKRETDHMTTEVKHDEEIDDGVKVPTKSFPSQNFG